MRPEGFCIVVTPMTYTAAVFDAPHKISMQSREAKTPGPGEILIRIRACGVCGTDIHIYHGSKGSAEVTPPVVLGHEMAGEIAAVGDGVSNFQPGDTVTVDPNMPCGGCLYCRSGHRHLCQDLTAIGVNLDGGFAEYCLVPECLVYRLPKSVPFEVCAPAEPVACCLHGVDRAGIGSGSTVAVVGTGAIGLIMVQLAFLSGADRVYVSEINERRRELAGGLGAVTIDPAEEDFVRFVKSDTGDGVDVSIECAGVPEAMAQALGCVRRGGSAVLFSVPEPDAVLTVAPFEIFHRELTIRGSFTNPATQGRAVRLIASKKLPLEEIVTHRFALTDVEAAFRAQVSPDSIKVMVRP